MPVLAAIREPDRFAHLLLVGPSPRYINDAPDYVGGFERKDIEGLLEMMDKNYIGWANFLAPVIMKNADRPELGEELTESFCSTDPVIARRFAEATFLADNRAEFSELFGDMNQLSSLLVRQQDRLDLAATTPLHGALQTEVTEYLHRLAEPSFAGEVGLFGERMLSPERTADVRYSFTLFERGEQGFAGGNDPANREPLWESGYGTDGELSRRAPARWPMACGLARTRWW